MIDNQTVKDFREGDIVQHIFWCRWGVVTKVGRKYITVHLTVGGTHKFLPTSLRHRELKGAND